MTPGGGGQSSKTGLTGTKFTKTGLAGAKFNANEVPLLVNMTLYGSMTSSHDV